MKPMNDTHWKDLLRDVSEGAIQTILHPSTNGTLSPLHGQTAGKGKLERFSLYPGLELTFFLFSAQEAVFQHRAAHSILEVHYCQTGRIGWDMKPNRSIYLGAGDLALHTLDCCAHSTMTFPLGYYQGVSIYLDFTYLPLHPPDPLREADLDFDALFSLCGGDGMPVTLAASPETDGIFSPLFGLPETLCVPYSKLKAQELLLFLSHSMLTSREIPKQYPARLVENVREIRDYLTQNLDQRMTIEALARKYLMNTTSLKGIFKAVFGMPLATYMKNYRMKEAARLLRETDDRILDIAKAVGYESQGKFAQAFKDTIGVLPTEYRKKSSL